VTSRARPVLVALALSLELGAGGCGARLANGVDRTEGLSGPVIDETSNLSSEDVPLNGHHVTVSGERRHTTVSGELIAVSDSEIVIDTVADGRRRVPLADVDRISIELHPSAGLLTAAITIGAMGLGFYGTTHASDMSHGTNEFLGGWGLVWIPAGIFIGLPTAIITGLSNDHSARRGTPAFDALVGRLNTFARYPQGLPGRAAVPPRPPGPAAPVPYEPPPPSPPPMDTPADASVD
jgi:hypothetical protein